MLPEKTYVSSQHQTRDFKNVMVRAAHAAGSQVTEETSSQDRVAVRLGVGAELVRLSAIYRV